MSLVADQPSDYTVDADGVSARPTRGEDRVAAALAALRRARPVVLDADGHGHLVAAARDASPAVTSCLIRESSGYLVAAAPAERLEALDLPSARRSRAPRAGGAAAEKVQDTLDDAGLICGPINTAADLVDDPQLRARGMLVTHHDERVDDVLGPGVVPLFSVTPGSVRWAGPPEPGHHNQEVYAELGLDTDELARLVDEKVI